MRSVPGLVRTTVVLAAAGVAAYVAAAGAAPQPRAAVVLRLSARSVDAGGLLRAGYSVSVPRGGRAELQLRRGAGRWATVATLRPRRHGVAVLRAPQGADGYRIAVTRGRRVLASSRPVTVYAYAPVALGTIASRPGGTVDVAGRQFRYAVAIFRRDDGVGVQSAPALSTLVSVARSTCRSASLTAAAVGPVPGASGGLLRVSVLAGGAVAASADLSADQLAPLSAPLGGGWELTASLVRFARIQNGNAKLDVAVGGSLSCYTPSGR